MSQVSTIPSGEANGEDHDDGDGHGDDQVLGLTKEEREKQKLKTKVYLIGALYFGDQDTQLV